MFLKKSKVFIISRFDCVARRFLPVKYTTFQMYCVQGRNESAAILGFAMVSHSYHAHLVSIHPNQKVPSFCHGSAKIDPTHHCAGVVKHQVQSHTHTSRQTRPHRSCATRVSAARMPSNRCAFSCSAISLSARSSAALSSSSASCAMVAYPACRAARASARARSSAVLRARTSAAKRSAGDSSRAHTGAVYTVDVGSEWGSCSGVRMGVGILYGLGWAVIVVCFSPCADALDVQR